VVHGSCLFINVGEKNADHQNANHALRRLLLSKKNTLVFLSIKSTKMAISGQK
jgi:hypothetical protein